MNNSMNYSMTSSMPNSTNSTNKARRSISSCMQAFVLAMAGSAATSAIAAAVTDVTFIDGGYAEMCSSAAHHTSGVQAMELTGTRMSISPVQICTMAINDRTTVPADRAASYNNRGVLLFDQGKLQEALADFDAAIAAAQTLAAAHVNRAYTLLALERWEDSIASFDRGIELGAPEPARAHFNRGVAHEEAGRVREAYYDYKLASELSPEWEEPQHELERFTVR
jgi:tetratricopeptide (TPR) repeat protein